MMFVLFMIIVACIAAWVAYESNKTPEALEPEKPEASWPFPTNKP